MNTPETDLRRRFPSPELDLDGVARHIDQITDSIKLTPPSERSSTPPRPAWSLLGSEPSPRSSTPPRPARQSERAASSSQLRAASSRLSFFRLGRELDELRRDVGGPYDDGPRRALFDADAERRDSGSWNGGVEPSVTRIKGHSLIATWDSPLGTLTSISALRELEEQIETLNTEREDLIKAIDKLRRGISELNREGRQRLLQSFEEVNEHFQDLFTKLFGGGHAHLELTEADDPLDAGLEIMASPPGKKLQNLTLLSGGEQALTALSLLFAVFLTNPAPICVLDEVDAPLDDANVDRFCSMLEEMSKQESTRFLIITHHRMTMARMDRLYGVTMSERGVSQLVSVDLQQAEEIRESA